MKIECRESLWNQFGAAIDTLSDAIHLCPENLWTVQMWKDPEDDRYGQFWFIAYHSLFWLDLFLTGTKENFTPPPQFIRGKLPDKPYTKDQIVTYLNFCRKKSQSTIEGLTDERAQQICIFEWMEPSFFELLLYCMRHLQEHAAQLSFVLGQHDVSGMDWVASARNTDL
jgi:hypothetical protein